MPRLLMLLASRSASLLNYSDVSRGLSLPQTTLKRYMALLEATFLVQFLPAWSGNLGNRLVKSPKLYLSDTGLAASLLGQADAEHLRQSPMFGPLVESFVVAELRKQATWSHTQPGMLHFRSAAGQEVDVVLESPAGEVVGVEIKAGAALSTADFRGLNALAQEAANRFHRGVLLYQGREVVPFGRNLHAVPIEALWEM
jgi:predicted AAA+ superfamily ATPase